jgi:uncharacterized membrane protein (UPF0127 family)
MIPWRVVSGRSLVGKMTVAVGVAALCALAALPACKSSVGPRPATGAAPADAATAAVVVDTGERQLTFHVELARTEEERERGLMYRDHLAPDAGMLFLFERPALQTFWMKNTLIPLDMIFISSDRAIVGIVANAEPLTLTPRAVNEPSQFVLEIGGGLAARLGIRAGQRLELRGVDGP